MTKKEALAILEKVSYAEVETEEYGINSVCVEFLESNSNIRLYQGDEEIWLSFNSYQDSYTNELGTFFVFDDKDHGRVEVCPLIRYKS